MLPKKDFEFILREALTNQFTKPTMTHVATSGYIYDWWFSKEVDPLAQKYFPTESNVGFYPNNISRTKTLAYYSTKFHSVEINATYYKLPTPNTIKVWREQTPPNFKFILKFSKFATTSKKLLNFKEYFDEFYALVSPLGQKLAGILIQLPPNFSYTTKKSTIDHLSPIDRVKMAGKHVQTNYSHVSVYIEFRHNSWFEKEAVDMVKMSGLKMVYVSEKDVITPSFEHGEQEDVYVRFHGTGKRIYTGNYPDEVLQYVANATSNAKTRWFVFNNTDSINCVVDDVLIDRKLFSDYKFCPSAIVDAMKIDHIVSS